MGLRCSVFLLRQFFGYRVLSLAVPPGLYALLFIPGSHRNPAAPSLRAGVTLPQIFLMNPNPEGDGAPQETTFKKPLPPRSRGDVSAGRSSGGLGTTSGKRKPPQGHPPRATAVAQPSKTQQNPQRPNKRKFLISRSMGTLRAFPQGGKRKRIDTATIPLQVRDVVDPPRTVQSDVVGFGDQTCLKDHAKSDPGNKEKYAEGERTDLGIYTERQVTGDPGTRRRQLNRK
mgnify:CR=1 FL=1